MMELIERSFVLSSAGWFLLFMMGFCSYVLISQMLDDHMSAMMGTPVVTFGAAVGQQFLRENGIQFNGDRTVDTGIGMMLGLIAASIVMSLMLWAVRAARARG